MSYTHPISKLVHSTVRISCTTATGQTSSGSGYIYLFCRQSNNDSIPCIVTNKHVIKGALRATFNLTLKNRDGSPNLGSHELVTVEEIEQNSIPHPDPSIDLVAIPIGNIISNASKEEKDYYIAAIDKNGIADNSLLQSLSPMEEIVMIGYPNGLWDETHNLPIIRKGITATHASIKMNGKPEFLIDAACFPGSSGSPVFLVNIGSFVSGDGSFCVGDRIALLGTLYAGPQHSTTGEIIVVDVPTDTKSLAIGSIPNNLGYVIQADELNNLENEVGRYFSKNNNQKSRNSYCDCGSGKRYKHCCGYIQ